MSLLENVLPHDLRTECELLGALMDNNEFFARVSDIVHVDVFYGSVNKLIFTAIKSIVGRGLSAHSTTVLSFLSKEKDSIEKDDFVLADYISDLCLQGAMVSEPVTLAKVLFDCYIRRKLIDICRDGMNHAYENNLKDSVMLEVEHLEKQLFQLGVNGYLENPFEKLSTCVFRALVNTESAMKNEGAMGVSTGFTDLDKLLHGFQDSDLLILAARPSMGKTALAVNLAYNACKNIGSDKGVAFFSLEMSADQIANRILSMLSGINSHRLRSGHLNNDEFTKVCNAGKTLGSLNLYIDDAPDITIANFKTRARRLKRLHNVSVIFVDYLQLLHPTHRKNNDMSKVHQIAEITQGLKAIAKELNIPIIALSQLSRAVEQREEKKPQLSDLRDSGSIEQDADIVLFLYREEYYLRRSEPAHGTEKHMLWQQQIARAEGRAEVIVAKQRNGPVGNVTLSFDGKTTLFDNYIPCEF